MFQKALEIGSKTCLLGRVMCGTVMTQISSDQVLSGVSLKKG